MSKRHGQLAEGMTRLSVVLSQDEKDALSAAAKKDKRSLSNWARLQLEAIASRAVRAAPAVTASHEAAAVQKPAKKPARRSVIVKVPRNDAIHAGMSTHVRQADVGKLSGIERDRKARDASA